MKKLLFFILLVGTCATSFSQDGVLTNVERQELLAKGATFWRKNGI